MKILKIMLTMLLFSISIIACNATEDRMTTLKDNGNNSLLKREGKSEQINIKFEGKRYELLENNAVAYFDEKNNYVGNIIIKDQDITIQNNSDSTGEIIVTNNSSKEFLVVKNIIGAKGKTIFDVETSTGSQFAGLEALNPNNKFAPILPIIRGIIALVSIIAVATSSGGTMADCVASMPKNCPQGYAPYAQYESGWFTSSCSVGCGK